MAAKDNPKTESKFTLTLHKALNERYIADAVKGCVVATSGTSSKPTVNHSDSDDDKEDESGIVGTDNQGGRLETREKKTPTAEKL